MKRFIRFFRLLVLVAMIAWTPASHADYAPIVFYNVTNWYDSAPQSSWPRFPDPLTAATTDWLRFNPPCSAVNNGEYLFKGVVARTGLGNPGAWDIKYQGHDCRPGGGYTNVVTYGSGVIRYRDCRGSIGEATIADGVGTCVESSSNPNPPKQNGPCAPCNQHGTPSSASADIGNPINIGVGNKHVEKTEYQSAGYSPLNFTWTYNASGALGILSQSDTTLGAQTTHNYQRFIHVTTSDSITTAYVLRPYGRTYSFNQNGTSWVGEADIADSLISQRNTSGNITGWQYVNAQTDDIETYDASGKLIRLQDRNGRVQTLTYSDASTSASIASVPNLLIQVTDAFGHSLNFTYYSNNRMHQLVDPSGQIISFDYDANNNFSSVHYPGGYVRTYLFNEQAYTLQNNLPFAMTGIVDENGNRFATYRYNSQKAIGTEHAGGVASFQINYADGLLPVVTDPLNTQRSYLFTTILGMKKITQVTQPNPSGTGMVSKSMTYDANGNVSTDTDFNGNVTTYSYDLMRNLETSRVEASGTAQSRTITTAWHAYYSLPLQIAEPKLLTTYAYDTSGNLLSKTVQATTDATGAQGLSPTLVGTARVWSYTYNNVGQVLTAIGPRTDVVDKTTYTYDTSGNLSTITNAVGQVTTLSNYDANGRVGLITDANGATTALTYSPRGWLTGKTVTSGGTVETTTYDYDGVGQLTLVTLPDTSTVTYTYDPAHRLTNIADSLGNSIVYTLDNMGNRINEQVKDPSGALARQTSRVVDALNRMQQITGSMQ
jgi:YD repeat-containing protein